MLARSEVYVKWVLYALAGLVCWMVQGTLLQRLLILGVFPFLYPLPAVMTGVLEGPLCGSIYGLAAGVLCDQLVAAPIPCLYTLVFPLAGMLSGLISVYGLKGGISCALVSSLLASAMTGGGNLLVLFLQGKSSLWPVGGEILWRETAVTLPLAIPVYLLFRKVHRHVHRFD